VVTNDLQVTVRPDAPPDDLQVVVTPDPVPSRVPETRAPAIVTRLVGLGLLVIGGAVVFTAMGHNNRVATTPSVDANTVAAVRPEPMPTSGHAVSAQRSGDVVLLRIDPTGGDGVRSLVVEPGATVTLLHRLGALVGPTVTLQDFLDAASSPVVRQAQLRLRYDANGAVRSISVLPAG
jgi:hypothetical protein